MTEAALSAQNWEALLRLELRAGSDRTRLVPLQRYGPLSVQRPFYPERECCHVYLLHPPGGVVGGDSLDLRVELQAGARGLFTAPGAAKFYLSAGQNARVRQTFRLGADAEFEFLPLANIYFPGALVDTATTIDAEPGARLILWEKHCFGRPANREAFDRGRVDSKIELRSGGRLVYTERQRFDAAEIARNSGLRGQPVSGTLLAFGAEFDAAMIGDLQQLKPERGTAGVSQVQPDLLLARYIGPASDDLDHYFTRLWECLRPPLLARGACRPRIWNT